MDTREFTWSLGDAIQPMDQPDSSGVVSARKDVGGTHWYQIARDGDPVSVTDPEELALVPAEHLELYQDGWWHEDELETP